MPQLALLAQQDGFHLATVALVDRWLRKAGATPQALALRAETLAHLGREQDAVEDLLHTLKIDPFHRAANTRLFARGDPLQRAVAAKAILDGGTRASPQALACLSGANDAGFAKIALRRQRLTGWCAWRAGATVRLEIRDASGVCTRTEDVAPQKDHPLSSILGAAADISSEFPFDSSAVALVAINGRVVSDLFGHALPGDDGEDAPPFKGQPQVVTIIVPVYDDAEATKLCLSAVEGVLQTSPDAKVVVVDDASPNPHIKRILRRAIRGRRRMLLTNERNVGYLASVNRALRRIGTGDVILLNADADPPKSLVEDMRAAARSDPRIGAINPLSNNGEFVSFPRPFQDNPLDLDALAASAATAAVANGTTVHDIPAGTGFCLYITRACLDAVGPLSTDFRRGYLEDADFGLRAREKGFRTVCASGVFVAHIGSRSFGREKAALVGRNRMTLERKFPSYFAESDAYVEADPLAAARLRIEARLSLDQPRRLLIGPIANLLAIRECGRRLRRAGIPVLMAVVTVRRNGWSAALATDEERTPQSLRAEVLPEADAEVQFEWRLREWRFDRAEIVAPSALPRSLVSLIETLAIPVDLLITGGGPQPGMGWNAPSHEARRDGASESLSRPPPPPFCHLEPTDVLTGEHRMFWESVLDRFGFLLFLDETTRRTWAASLPRGSPVRQRLVLREGAASARQAPHRSGAKSRATATQRVGILFPEETPLALKLVLHLGERLSALKIDAFLFGATSLDQRLIARGVFVSGRIAPQEWIKVVRQLQVDVLFLPYRCGFLWLLEEVRASVPVPSAYFGSAKRKDLSIDPRLSDQEAVALLCGWLENTKHAGTRSASVRGGPTSC